jgi:preprotein translocase subunit SecE
MSKFREYIDNTTDELKNKVSWPTWEELQSSTSLVLVASLIFAIVVMIIDFVGSQTLDLIYNLAI